MAHNPDPQVAAAEIRRLNSENTAPTTITRGLDGYARVSHFGRECWSGPRDRLRVPRDVDQVGIRIGF